MALHVVSPMDVSSPETEELIISDNIYESYCLSYPSLVSLILFIVVLVLTVFIFIMINLRLRIKLSYK